MDGLASIQRVTSTERVASRKTIIECVSEHILSKIPAPFQIEEVMKQYPAKYEESLNTVLTQEVIRYNTLIHTVVSSLNTLHKALNGMVVMSQQLEEVCASLYENSVPKTWTNKAYSSLKPLAAWVDDLVERLSFIQRWITNGAPVVFW